MLEEAVGEALLLSSTGAWMLEGTDILTVVLSLCNLKSVAIYAGAEYVVYDIVQCQGSVNVCTSACERESSMIVQTQLHERNTPKEGLDGFGIIHFEASEWQHISVTAVR